MAALWVNRENQGVLTPPHRAYSAIIYILYISHIHSSFILPALTTIETYCEETFCFKVAAPQDSTMIGTADLTEEVVSNDLPGLTEKPP